MSKFYDIADVSEESLELSIINSKTHLVAFETAFEGYESFVVTEGFGKKIVDGVKYVWGKFKDFLRMVKNSLLKCWKYIKSKFSKSTKQEDVPPVDKEKMKKIDEYILNQAAKLKEKKEKETKKEPKEIRVSIIKEETLNNYINGIKSLVVTYIQEYNEISRLIDDAIANGIDNIKDSDFIKKFSEYGQFKVIYKNNKGISNPLFDNVPNTGSIYLLSEEFKFMSDDPYAVKKLTDTIRNYTSVIEEIEKVIEGFEKVVIETSRKQDDLFNRITNAKNDFGVRFRYAESQTRDMVLQPIKRLANDLLKYTEGVIKELKNVKV